MLDLLNVNVGGGARPMGRGNTVSVYRETERVTLPVPTELETTKFAKRLVKLLDVAGMDYYGVAAALWDVAPDGVKSHIYRLVDALLDVAADKHEAGLDYSLTEREIATGAKALRDTLHPTGVSSDTLDYLEGLTRGK